MEVSMGRGREKGDLLTVYVTNPAKSQAMGEKLLSSDRHRLVDTIAVSIISRVSESRSSALLEHDRLPMEIG
jgi:hypothetical protein